MSSTQHTAGPLEVGDDSKWGGEPVRIESAFTTDLVATIPVASVTDFPRADANARRLVACWNAFEGIPTEKVEDGGPIIHIDGGPREPDPRMQSLVDALAKTETYLLERVSSKAGSTGATVILPMIRRAIEGAGVAPTQTSWGDV